jgi:hypothetical protein
LASSLPERTAGGGATLLVTPPFVQLNGPYAATPFLAGTLAAAGRPARQVDASIDCFLALFSRGGLERLFAAADARRGPKAAAVRAVLANKRRYLDTIDPVVAFLQGRRPELAWRIAGRQWLPEGPRFAQMEQIAPQFGDLEQGDGARLLASLYLDELQDFAAQTVLPGYGLSRYQESLAASAPSLSPLLARLKEPGNLLFELLAGVVAGWRLDDVALLAITVPFPGNLPLALKLAELAKQRRPDLPVALGGGYVSTELRELADDRLFDYTDYLCFDDGEAPLLALLDHLEGRTGPEDLVRTMAADGRGGIARHGFGRTVGELRAEPWNRALGVPDYAGLDQSKYLALVESPNLMHRLWSERGFFKLRMAHGCYWHRCAFCDTSLDYIARYRPINLDILLDQVRTVQRATGLGGIHFVDEAMPAGLAGRFGEALARAGTTVSWWGNVRFDRSFTSEVAAGMANGGCVGVSGGMEAVHPRLLAAMDKGCGIQEMAGALAAFADSGIMTHAYLIYGFPGSTVQETVDALEIIRQCFVAGILHSAFWHRFILTAHSPAARDPGRFGITRVVVPESSFARNDLSYEAEGPDIDWMGQGLRTAVHNWMNGAGRELPVGHWFERPVPETSLAADFIRV